MATCVLCGKRANADTGYCKSCLFDQYPPVRASKATTPWMYSKPVKKSYVISPSTEKWLALAGAFLAGCCATLLVFLIVW